MLVVLLVLLILLLLLRPQSSPLPDGRHPLVRGVAVTQPRLLRLCWATDWQVVRGTGVAPCVVALHTGVKYWRNTANCPKPVCTHPVLSVGPRPDVGVDLGLVADARDPGHMWLMGLRSTGGEK